MKVVIPQSQEAQDASTLLEDRERLAGVAAHQERQIKALEFEARLLREENRVLKQQNGMSPVPTQAQRAVSTAYALAYAMALPTLQRIAREHGYCLAVHGSMATDLDVVACPWTEEASEPDALAEALRECIGGMFAAGHGSASEDATERAHGRRSYTILPSNLFLGVPRLPQVPWIDLSIMPRKTAAVQFILPAHEAAATEEGVE